MRNERRLGRGDARGVRSKRESSIVGGVGCCLLVHKLASPQFELVHERAFKCAFSQFELVHKLASPEFELVHKRALPEFEGEELEDLQVVVFAPRKVGVDDAADFRRAEEAAAADGFFGEQVFDHRPERAAQP